MTSENTTTNTTTANTTTLTGKALRAALALSFASPAKTFKREGAWSFLATLENRLAWSEVEALQAYGHAIRGLVYTYETGRMWGMQEDAIRQMTFAQFTDLLAELARAARFMGDVPHYMAKNFTCEIVRQDDGSYRARRIK